MRKTLRALVAGISVLVAILAIFSFIYRLGEIRTSGERSSGAEYSILRNALMSLQTRIDMQDPGLRNRLVALYKGSGRLLAAQVHDSSGLAVWRLPADSAYFALPQDNSVRVGFSAPEWSTVVFTTPLSDGMKLSALYTTVLRSDISAAARLPLVIAAAWCLLLALAIILLGNEKIDMPRSARAEVPDEETAPEAPEIPSARTAGLADAFRESPEAQGKTPEPEEMAGTEEEAPYLAIDIDSPEDEELAEEPLPEDEAQALPETPKAPVQPLSEALRSGRSFEESLAKLEEEIVEWTSHHPDQAMPRTEARDIRAADDEPASEIQDELDEELSEELEELETSPEEEPDGKPENGWADSRETLQEFEELNAEALAEKPEVRDEEPAASPAEPKESQDLASFPMPLLLGDSQLEARLGEELGRGARAEVSLMLIHCTVSSRSDPAATALAVTIKDYIGSKDLVFELYKGAFAVVLPSVDLGGALKMSEDLADVLSATLSLYKDIDGEAPVFIGISARSERKVDAYKIYREASTAVHKAFSGSHSRILAFRPKAE